MGIERRAVLAGLAVLFPEVATRPAAHEQPNGMLDGPQTRSKSRPPHAETLAQTDNCAAIAMPSIGIEPASVPLNATVAYVKVRLSAPAPHTISARITARNGSDWDHANKSGLQGVHYRPFDSYLTFHPGEMVQDIEVPLISGSDGRWFEVFFPEQLEPYNVRATPAAARVTWKASAVNAKPQTASARPRAVPVKGELAFTMDIANFDANEAGVDASGKRVYRSRLAHGRTQTRNGELGLYTDPKLFPGTRPFEVRNDVLILRGEKFPAPIRYPRSIDGGDDKYYTYGSSVVTTQGLHEQRYGYFEWEVIQPWARGAWSAGWLLPADGSWPPEIDVWDIPRNGAYLKHDINLGHNWVTCSANPQTISSRINLQRSLGKPVNLVDEFHSYGLDWRSDFTTWYVDDVEIFQMPSRFHKPAYALLDVAIGGWGGAVDLTTGSAEMAVRSFRIWK